VADLPSDQGNWTRCTARCTHRGPYRVHYRSGETFVVNTKGCAPANYALIDHVIVAKVTAPHGQVETDEEEAR
jgi:hypothetical protein